MRQKAGEEPGNETRPLLGGIEIPFSFLMTVGTPTNSNSGGRPLSVCVRVVLSVMWEEGQKREEEGRGREEQNRDCYSTTPVGCSCIALISLVPRPRENEARRS